ncbi:uncharacterized protein LOC129228651 [Uloborus diversus]|uniref:uncharacterized protein LOC129228651 n=1 Tax=Uloborus diversus TaxID=327109 RepID=UPI00240A8F25|nr:uncharacterized protein LOC129228651 [Uloborus diversus]
MGHQLNLAVSQAAAEIAYLVKYQDILKRIHAYFECSPANTTRLKNAQESLDQTPKKFLKLSATRWLSLGNAVAALDCNWQALVCVLLEDKRPVAQGLLKNITSYLSLATTAIMSDVMFVMNKLCTTFQNANLDFENVQISVDASIANLKEMTNGTGTHFMSFMDAAPKEASEHFEFQGHVILDGQKQREKFRNVMTTLLNSTINNVIDRLGDLHNIKMFNIFLPSNIPQDSSKLNEYGQKEIKCIYKLLSSSSALKDVTEIDMLCEWGLFKHILQQRCRNLTFKELLAFLHVNDMSEEFPLMFTLIEYCATFPMHWKCCTVDCERGFSSLNLIKNDIRNRLTIHNINHLLMINLEGPANGFNFNEAFAKWANMKERRILQCKPNSFVK